MRTHPGCFFVSLTFGSHRIHVILPGVATEEVIYPLLVAIVSHTLRFPLKPSNKGGQNIKQHTNKGILFLLAKKSDNGNSESLLNIFIF